MGVQHDPTHCNNGGEYGKTKAQLVEELRSLSERVAELEACDAAGERDSILRAIAEGTSSAGPAFFASFVCSLARALAVRYAFVAECVDRPTTRVRTLAFWMGDHLGENVQYEIEGTPCKDVCEGETSFHCCDIQRLFPADLDLVELRAESYCGLPLRDTSGRIIGHLAIMDVAEMTDNVGELPAVKIFAARAAAELERRRADSEKMFALGQLTAGIAHEMNTPIGVVNSSADSFRICANKLEEAIERNRTLADLLEDRGFRQSLEIIRESSRIVSEASSRIGSIVSSLKRFSVEDSSHETANLRNCVEGALALISNQAPAGITIEKKLIDVPAVSCGPAALSEVLVTILTNALQAIRVQGKITVETGSDHDRAVIRVSDTGGGILKEKLRTLFDFTFITKGSRVGVGMGLANAYNIVQRCNGGITASSEIGKGSTFTVTLPIHTGASV